MKREEHNLTGTPQMCEVYAVSPVPSDAYWPAVTDVPCPVTGCAGIVRWAEAGYVPGYRICDGKHHHFVASGNGTAPKLIRVPGRRRPGK